MPRVAEFLWRRGKQAAEHHGESLTIGSRLPCDLVLDDPVAAARHAVVHFTGTGFELEALPTATGTYVDGELVDRRRPLREGDRVVVGVSRLEVTAIDAIAARIEFALAERSFFFVAKQSREFHSDTDEWVRSEVRFGRMPRLRLANAVAVVLALASIVFALASRTGERALSPGPLSDAHAWLLSDDAPPRAVAAALAALPGGLVASAREQGCAACHGDGGGVEQQRCVACHPELGLDAVAHAAVAVPPRHPFELGARTDCADCHREHGAPLRPAKDGAPRAVACSACHDEHDDDAVAREAALARLGGARETAHRARVATRGFEAFDHGSHAALDCARCHGADPGDRSALSFELCAECHRPGGAATGVGPVAALAWHGSDGGGCTACHEQSFDAALREVDVLVRAPLAARFRMPEVPHDDVLHARIGERACAECHLAGTVAAGGGELAAFRHEDHVSTLAPRDAEGRARVLAECRACHVEMISRNALVVAPAAYAGPPADSCVECHGADGAVEALAVATDGPTRRAPAFDHAAHADVDGGCLACHAVAGAPSDGVAANGHVAHAASCRECHIERVDGGLAHRHFAGASDAACDACHAPGPGDRLAAVFYAPARAVPRSPLAGFAHDTPGHAAADCSECHGTPAPGREVHVPTAMGASCTECHLATRFHWR